MISTRPSAMGHWLDYPVPCVASTQVNVLNPVVFVHGQGMRQQGSPEARRTCFVAVEWAAEMAYRACTPGLCGGCCKCKHY